MSQAIRTSVFVVCSGTIHPLQINRVFRDFFAKIEPRGYAFRSAYNPGSCGMPGWYSATGATVSVSYIRSSKSCAFFLVFPGRMDQSITGNLGRVLPKGTEIVSVDFLTSTTTASE